jgi:hypothetical protein
VTDNEALSALTAILERLREILSANKRTWDAEPVVRLASSGCGSPPATSPRSAAV